MAPIRFPSGVKTFRPDGPEAQTLPWLSTLRPSPPPGLVARSMKVRFWTG